MNKTSVILIGDGGHARVLLDILRLNNIPVLGITKPNANKNEKWNGLNILGDDKSIFDYSNKEIYLVNGLGKSPKNNIRKKIKLLMKKRGYKFFNVIHPSALISSDVTIMDGVQVMAGAIVQTGVYLGDSVIVNTGSIIEHDCYIKEDSHIAPGVTLNGNVTIGNNSHVGTGTSIIQNITVGNNTTIAAGSIIHKNLGDNLIYIQKRNETIIC